MQGAFAQATISQKEVAIADKNVGAVKLTKRARMDGSEIEGSHGATVTKSKGKTDMSRELGLGTETNYLSVVP